MLSLVRLTTPRTNCTTQCRDIISINNSVDNSVILINNSVIKLSFNFYKPCQGAYGSTLIRLSNDHGTLKFLVPQLSETSVQTEEEKEEEKEEGKH